MFGMSRVLLPMVVAVLSVHAMDGDSAREAVDSLVEISDGDQAIEIVDEEDDAGIAQEEDVPKLTIAQVRDEMDGAKRKTKVGVVLTVVGNTLTMASVTGTALWESSLRRQLASGADSDLSGTVLDYLPYLAIGFTGAGLTYVGVPMAFSGKSRVSGIGEDIGRPSRFFAEARLPYFIGWAPEAVAILCCTVSALETDRRQQEMFTNVALLACATKCVLWSASALVCARTASAESEEIERKLSAPRPTVSLSGKVYGNRGLGLQVNCAF